MSQIAKTHLGIALGIGSFALLIEGVWQVIAFIIAGILLLSFIIIWLCGKSKIALYLAQFSFDNVALFLGIITLAIVLLTKNPLIGIIAIIIAYALLAWDIGSKIGEMIKHRRHIT